MKIIPILLTLAPFLCFGEVTSKAETATAVAAEKAPTAFSEFEAYAPLAQALAAEPNRAKELEFLHACRSRLLQRIDRTESTAALLARFKQEFDPKTIHQATAIAVATLVANQNGAFTKEHGDLAATLLEQHGGNTTPAIAILSLCARAGICRYRSCGPYAANDAPLKNWITEQASNLGFPDDLRNTPQEPLLYDLFTNKPVNPYLAAEEQAANAKFFALITKIPVNERSAAMHCALGDHESRLAWIARGTNFANETTEAQFEGFEKHLTAAGESYRAALKLDAKHASAYLGLLNVAMASETAAGASTHTWFERAQANIGLTTNLLYAYAAANKPRWGGDPEAIIHAYEIAINHRDYDNILSWVSTDIIAALNNDLDGEPKERVTRMLARDFIGIANGYTQRLNETGKQLVGTDGYPFNFHAKAVAKLVDADMIDGVKKLTPCRFPEYAPVAIGNVTPFISADKQPHYARLVAESETGDDELFRKIDTRLRENNPKHDSNYVHAPVSIAELDQQQALLLDSLKKAKSNLAREYIETRQAVIACKRDFAEGKIARIPLRQDCWYDNLKTMSFDGDAITADLYTWHRANHYATYEDAFEPPYEVTLTIRSNWYTQWPHPGVFIGRCFTARADKPAGRGFVIEPDTGTLRVMPPSSGLNAVKLTMKHKDYAGKECRLRVRVFERGYAVAVNEGAPKSKRDELFRPYLISIGGLPGYMCNGRFEYRDITVRKIPATEMTAEETALMSLTPPAPKAKAAPAQTAAKPAA